MITFLIGIISFAIGLVIRELLSELGPNDSFISDAEIELLRPKGYQPQRIIGGETIPTIDPVNFTEINKV